jgi:hypothetical protein
MDGSSRTAVSMTGDIALTRSMMTMLHKNFSLTLVREIERKRLEDVGTAEQNAYFETMALDQKWGQTRNPKLIKPTWEKGFGQLRDSDRTARLPD